MRKLLPLLCLLLLATLLGSTPAGADRAGEDRTWRGLDVPYLSGGRVHFRGNAAREPYPDPDHPTSLVAVAATRTAAILQADESTLVELPARRGELRLLTRRLVGIPMADPVGDWAFWTQTHGRQVRLVGYDARRNVVRRGPLLGRQGRVWAVDGATAYVSTRGRYASWTPGGRLRPSPLDADELFLSDVHRGRAVLNDMAAETGRVRVVGPHGAALAELPDALGDTFDPSGRFLALWGGAVWDVAADEVARLRLGRRWEAVQQRWAPSGELVVLAEDAHPDRAERNPARRFVCAPATGACDRLPDPVGVGRYTLEHEPWVPSALVQLGALVGS